MLQQILNMPDDEKNLWINSMNVELAALWNKECFELVKVSAAKGHQIMPLTWAFKFKSKPDGTYYKHKSQLCLHSDKMVEGLEEGVSADETSGYAPVIDWGTIRMLLTLTVNFNLHTTAVDFRSAFIQAKLDRPFFAQIPPYLDTFPQYAGKILKIKRSHYGHHSRLVSSTNSSMTTWSNPRTRADSASISLTMTIASSYGMMPS